MNWSDACVRVCRIVGIELFHKVAAAVRAKRGGWVVYERYAHVTFVTPVCLGVRSGGGGGGGHGCG